MARKMALVPAEFAAQNLLQQHTPLAPVLNQLSHLDQQMKSVLDDVTTTPDVKLGKYYSALRRYETLQDNAAKVPVPVQILEKRAAPATEPLDQKELPVAEGEILEQVPRTQQKTAKLLLKYIKDNSNIKWNQNKELMVDGTRVPGSNIFDLVSDMTRNRKNPAAATGWQEFTDALIPQNIPEAAVGNKQRWQYIVNQLRSPAGAVSFLTEEEEDDEEGYETPKFTPSPSALKQQKRKQKKQAFSPIGTTPKQTPKRKRQNAAQFDAMYRGY